MLITLKRFHFLDACTIGHLLIDGKDTSFFTLEDKDREQHGAPVDLWKVPGETAIPRGIYKIEVRHSPRFAKDMPYLMGVPGFDAVMMHPGNTSSDTEGCILVGEQWSGKNFIGDSREAFERVRQAVLAARKRKEKIEIHVC